MEMLKSVPANLKPNLDELKKFGEEMLSGRVDVSMHEGKAFPPGFLAESVKFARDDWKGMRDTDVYVASCLKVGTNWVTELVWKMISYNDASMYETAHSLPMAFNALECGPASKFPILDALPLKRRVFLTHINGDDFPVEKAAKAGAKMIYVIRNPKDQTVSWYHFARKHPSRGKAKEMLPDDFHEFIKFYHSGMHPMAVDNKKGHWYPDHILSWYKHRNNPNVHFVYYEDLKEDSAREILKMAKFLGVKIDAAQAKEVATRCEFKNMKNTSETANAAKGQLHDFRATLNVMRKGQVGEWKEYFTVAESERLDQVIEEKLGGTDIKFKYVL